MKKEELLIECNIKNVRKKLQLTLDNINIQGNILLWDDHEEINDCIQALKIIEKEKKHYLKKLTSL
jgi:hypothetical protein